VSTVVVPRLRGAALADLGSASILAGAVARRRAAMRVLVRTPADTRALARIERCAPIRFGACGTGHPPAPHGDTGSARRRPSTVRIPRPVRSRHQGATPGVEQVPASRRADLAQTNEAVLYIPADLHRVAEPFARVIADEAMLLLADPHTQAAWTRWWRLVRRLVLGEAARRHLDHRGPAASAVLGQLGAPRQAPHPDARALLRPTVPLRRDPQARQPGRCTDRGRRSSGRGRAGTAVAVRVRHRQHGGLARPPCSPLIPRPETDVRQRIRAPLPCGRFFGPVC
jgi:hypothetical protein